MLSSMVDFPLSVQKKRIAIQEGICDELDEVKRRFEGLSDFLHDVALEEMNDLPQDASDIDFYVMFVPQLGYMVTCPNDDARRTLEIVQGYKLNFATSEMAYFKTPRMEELDSNVGDIYGKMSGHLKACSRVIVVYMRIPTRSEVLACQRSCHLRSRVPARRDDPQKDIGVAFHHSRRLRASLSFTTHKLEYST